MTENSAVNFCSTHTRHNTTTSSIDYNTQVCNHSPPSFPPPQNKHINNTILHYCKRFYFRAINFSRFAAQIHIRGLLNSRWADAHLSFLYCTNLTSFNEWYILQVYLTGQHKNKAGLRQTRVYYPFASTHMVNTQLLRVQNVHTKYREIFSRVFEFALAEFPRN